MKKLASHEEVRERFDLAFSARRYATALVGTATDRRERRCIAKALASVPAGSSVLDLPCGTGRLLPFLVGLGYEVVAADSSAHMIEAARSSAQDQELGLRPESFHVVDALEAEFADGEFDAVVCNRLFHHFAEPAVRRQALRELGRICKGLIVVSFFRVLAYDAVTYHLKHKLLFRPVADRIPIRLRTFEKDIVAAGLVLKAAMGTRPLISKQWYVVLEREGGGAS